jgi:hypothetical protein
MDDGRDVDGFETHESLNPRGERVRCPHGSEGDHVSKAGEGHHVVNLFSGKVRKSNLCSSLSRKAG